MEMMVAQFDSDYYSQERLLRIKVLREPLGLKPGTEVFPYEFEARHFVAVEEDKVIACVLMHIRPEETKLFQMAVSNEYQNKGVGRSLVKFFEEKAAELGIKKIFCNSRWEAYGFYKKLGFIEDGKPFLEVGLKHIKMVKEI